MCTTPSAVKSLMLKYVELLQGVEQVVDKAPQYGCPAEMFALDKDKALEVAGGLARRGCTGRVWCRG